MVSTVVFLVFDFVAPIVFDLTAMFANQTFFSSKNPSPSSLIVFIEC